MPVATILASAVHQPLDLALGEMASLDCQVYDGWSAFSGPRFHRNKAPILEAYWLSYMLFLHSRKPAACTVIAMQDGGAGAGARHETAAHFCLATERLCGPPAGGTFRFQIFIKGSSPEIWSETVSGSEEVLVRK